MNCGPGDKAHYYIQANPGRLAQSNENLIQYVYLDSNVREILLQVYVGQGDGEHRVYWGEDLIQTDGTNLSTSLMWGGALPPANRWVRLRIPVSALGLAGKTIKGILFASTGGTALWDKTTTSNSSLDSGALGYTLPLAAGSAAIPSPTGTPVQPSGVAPASHPPVWPLDDDRGGCGFRQGVRVLRDLGPGQSCSQCDAQYADMDGRRFHVSNLVFDHGAVCTLTHRPGRRSGLMLQPCVAH